MNQDSGGRSLRAKVTSAFVWNVGFNLVRDALQFLVMLALVRLLPHDAYGKFALVTSIIGFVSVFSYNHFLAQIVQAPPGAELHLQEHFTAGAILAIGLFVVTNAVAFGIRLSGDPQGVATLVHLMSLTFLNAFPCDFRIKLLERELDWRRLRALHLIGLVASSVVALLMGWAGADAYALLVPGFLVNIPFTFDLFVKERWRPRWAWSWRNYAGAWSFGTSRVGSGLANSGRQLIEAGALASVLGVGGLGVFNRATGLALLFCQRFPFQMMYSIYPALTQARVDLPTVRRLHVAIFKIVAWTGAPVAALFSALAMPVVLTVYGDRWVDVVPFLPAAMLAGALAALSQTANSLLLSRHMTRACLVADVSLCIATIALVIGVLPTSPILYLVGLAFSHGVIFGFLAWWLSAGDALNLGDLWSVIVPPAVACAVSYGLCQSLAAWVAVPIDHFTTAAIYGALFGLTYCLCIRALFGRYLADLIRPLPGGRLWARVFMLRP